MREAFLEFVKKTEIPEEAYSASIRSPNFVLPDWFDFEETLGQPVSAYWLDQALIIWFERQAEERLKITVEVGPILYKERYQLLTMLEKQGITFQQNAKQEGKKYTKIYTAWTEVKDWASKQEVLNSMLELYDTPQINDVFQKIALSVEAMTQMQEEETVIVEQIEQVEPSYEKKVPSIPKAAFLKFCTETGISEDHRNPNQRYPSFIIPAFAKIEERFGMTRINWWWHNGPFVFFFDHLRDGRLKLVLELGPLHGDQRVALIEELEAYGVNFKAASKLRTAKYTQLYTNTKVVDDWQDEEQVSDVMTELFKHPQSQELLEVIGRIGEESMS